MYAGLVRHLVPSMQALRVGDIEVGVAVCRVDDKLHLSSRRILSFGATYLYRCDVGETDAFIHSHITSDKASLKDHMTAIKNNLKHMCIIYPRDGEEWIKCYKYDLTEEERKQLLKEMEEIQEEAEKSNIEKYRKAVEEYDKKFYLCQEKIEY